MARKAAPALRRSSSSIISACPSAVVQLAWPQSGIELVEAHDFDWRHAAGEMRRHELARMIEACGGDQLSQSMERRSMEVLHPHPFVVNHQSTLAGGVLRSHADRASVGMAALGLDAAEREHECRSSAPAALAAPLLPCCLGPQRTWRRCIREPSPRQKLRINETP